MCRLHGQQPFGPCLRGFVFADCHKFIRVTLSVSVLRTKLTGSKNKRLYPITSVYVFISKEMEFLENKFQFK